MAPVKKRARDEVLLAALKADGVTWASDVHLSEEIERSLIQNKLLFFQEENGEWRL